MSNFLSSTMKLLYAFVWQEWALTKNPVIFKPAFNKFGNEVIPSVNWMANLLNNFDETDHDLQVNGTSERITTRPYSHSGGQANVCTHLRKSLFVLRSVMAEQEMTAHLAAIEVK